jgi:hypothetical protein
MTDARVTENLLAIFRRLAAGRRFARSEAEAFDDPWLHRAVRRNGLGPIAFAHGLLAFQDEYRASAVDARGRASLAGEALGALAVAGIRASPLKGASVAHTLYDEPAHRPMNDLDLLVPPADFERAVVVLERLGYRRTLSPRTSFATSGTMTFERTEGGEPIDLHATVLHALRCRLDLEHVWGRAKPGFGPFPMAWRLDPIDQALFHFAHAAKHELAVSLLSYLDGVRYLARMSEGDRRRLLVRARESRMGRAVSAAVQATEALRDGTEVASGMLPTVRELARYDEASRLRRLFRRVMLAEGPREILGLAIIGWRRHTARAEPDQPTA